MGGISRLRAFGFLLRAYSYLFHLIFSLFLIGVALLANSGEQLNLTGLVPFSPDNIVHGLVISGIVGLLCTLLAITGIFRYLFPLWVTVVLIFTVRGFFFSSYMFPGEHAFQGALWLAIAVLVAFFGGIWVLKPRKGRL
jgi:fumarate reductase subunit C